MSFSEQVEIGFLVSIIDGILERNGFPLCARFELMIQACTICVCVCVCVCVCLSSCCGYLPSSIAMGYLAVGRLDVMFRLGEGLSGR